MTRTSRPARTARTARTARPARAALAALPCAGLLAAATGCSLAEEVSEDPDGAASAPADTGASTASPTPSPSASPTASASPSATSSPTAAPSDEPSASPTEQTEGDTGSRLAALRPGEFFVDDTRLAVRDVCRTGSSSFELFLEDGSRFYFDLLRDGSAIKDGQVFDPDSFENIRQVAPLAENRGEAPRVRVAGVEMRSDAGYTFDAAFLVTTADRDFCGA